MSAGTFARCWERFWYYLVTYTDISDAEARKEAEEAIFQTVLPFYAAWQEKAAEDAQWAKISVTVRRDQNDRLYLELIPKIK